jgi:hypothetical protein
MTNAEGYGDVGVAAAATAAAAAVATKCFNTPSRVVRRSLGAKARSHGVEAGSREVDPEALREGRVAPGGVLVLNGVPEARGEADLIDRWGDRARGLQQHGVAAHDVARHGSCDLDVFLVAGLPGGELGEARRAAARRRACANRGRSAQIVLPASRSAASASVAITRMPAATGIQWSPSAGIGGRRV